MKIEIKYRAWDRDMKEMVFVSGIQFDPHSPREKPNIIDERNDIRDLEEVELMQYTGLKDHQGKDICEGDIVKFIGGTANFLPCGIYSYQKHEIGTILIVMKLLSGFTLQRVIHINDDTPNLIGNVDNYTLWNHQKSFKVIGNIHENPELFRDK